jgi:flagellar hook-basal body complex protein FliE
MSLPIAPIGNIVAPEMIRIPAAAGSGDFRALFESAVQGVEKFQAQAAQSAGRFLSGESEELHQTALDTQRAELAFEMFLQVRNKVVQAYQEIMRMQM